MSKKLAKSNFPPGGFTYREPSLNWVATPELAGMGHKEVAKALQTVRIQNPTSGLNPEMSACLQAVIDYTCARLPEWCEDERDVSFEAIPTKGKKKKKCASCGKRR